MGNPLRRKKLFDIFNYQRGNFIFWKKLGADFFPIFKKQGDFVGSMLEPCTWIIQGIEHNHVKILGLKLGLGIFFFLVGFKCKTYMNLVFSFLFAQGESYIHILFKFQYHILLFFLDFF